MVPRRRSSARVLVERRVLRPAQDQCACGNGGDRQPVRALIHRRRIENDEFVGVLPFVQ